jgi:hypothetical protein
VHLILQVTGMRPLGPISKQLQMHPRRGLGRSHVRGCNWACTHSLNGNVQLCLQPHAIPVPGEAHCLMLPGNTSQP